MAKQQHETTSDQNDSASGPKTPRVEVWDTSRLTESEYSRGIYGDEDDTELVSSIDKHGVVTPLVVLPDGRVIAGSRRLRAARKLGLPKLPIVVRDDLKDANDHEIHLHEILSNAGRQKSKIVKDREIAELVKIEAALAKMRQKAHLKQGKKSRGADSAPRRTGERGEAAAIVANQTGESRGRVRKIKEVTDAIKQKNADGDDKGAAELEQTVASQGFDTAHRWVVQEKARTKKKTKGKNGSKSGTKEKKQIMALEQRVRDYRNVGLDTSAKQLHRELARARNGAKDSDVPTVKTLYRREMDRPLPTKYDEAIGSIRIQIDSVKSSVALIAGLIPDFRNVKQNTARANNLSAWLKKALAKLEKLADLDRRGLRNEEVPEENDDDENDDDENDDDDETDSPSEDDEDGDE